MSKDVFDGFKVNVFLDEDGDYLAHFVEMPNVSAFSDTPEGALRELAIAWEGVKKSYQKHHESIPKAPARGEDEAPFKVAIDAQLYHALTHEASKSGMSLYAFVAQKLKSMVSVVQD
ncbi:MAG: type II toxin-antitoxin system HicB family antitoxin [Candidatus Poribacteria bacterium]|nr:type II toxin-antitoxin system HicB family antitoxin [Candidatus Poribacteria bacterium]